MPDISEETALNLLDELMQLNSNIKTLIAVMRRDAPPAIHPPLTPPQEPPKQPEQPPPDNAPPEPTVNVDFEPIISSNQEPKGKKYTFIGDPAYDVTKDVPECYKQRGFGSPECLEKKDDCVYAKNCEELTTRDKGSAQEPSGETPEDPQEEPTETEIKTRTAKEQEIADFAKRIKDLKEG